MKQSVRWVSVSASSGEIIPGSNACRLWRTVSDRRGTGFSRSASRAYPHCVGLMRHADVAENGVAAGTAGAEEVQRWQAADKLWVPQRGLIWNDLNLGREAIAWTTRGSEVSRSGPPWKTDMCRDLGTM